MKKIAFLFSIYVVVTSFSFRSYSQDKTEDIFLCGYTDNTKQLDINTTLKEESFVGNKNIEILVDKIVNLIGLPKNFIIVSYPNIKNALAITTNTGIRYIVYDPDFINGINNATTNWSTLGILAHEIGHHLSGHTLTKSKTLEEQRAKEIEADAFSGFIMFKLGASLFQAENWMNLISSNDDDTYSTHPALNKRKLSIEIGYEKARSQDAFYKYDSTKSVEEYCNDASALLLSKQYFDAIGILKKAIKLNDKYFRAFHDLGFCQQALNDDYNAISNYNESIKINPNFDKSYLNRGSIKDKLKDYAGAIEDYDIVIKISPRYAMAYNNRGHAKQNIGDYKGSIDDLTKAIELQPNYPDAYLNRSGSYCLLKKFKKGISDCDKAIELKPNMAPAYFNRASIKGQMKNLSGMCDDLSIACKLGWLQACKAYSQYCQ